MRIVIASDAWFPQINGVVRTLDTLRKRLTGDGHDVLMLTPDRFPSVPCPSYREIRLAWCRPGTIAQLIDDFAPQAIHVATEGPVGLAVSRFCVRRGCLFTTSFHTRFPEYIHVRWRIPLGWSYGFVRWFHAAAARTMVATPSVENDLNRLGFRNLCRWTRGVDTELFHPRDKNFFPYPRPISLYVGRVAVEKNIEAFLQTDLPGTKVVVGDGPIRKELEARYPAARFLGAKTGEDLARHFASADVFVFPSRTDTFGLVLLEAMASGVPVAAYPVSGSLDVIDGSGAGCLDENLGRAIHEALEVSPEVCRAHAERYSWDNSAQQFLGNLHPVA